MTNVYLDFYHRKSFAKPKDARALLELLLADATFAPDRWAPFEPINRPLDRQALGPAAESFANFENTQKKNSIEKWTGSILLKRTKVPKCLFGLEWSHLRHRPFNISYFGVAQNWLKTPARLAALLDFTESLYFAFDHFWFACIGCDEEKEEKRRLKWFRPDRSHPDGGYTIQEAPGIFLEKGIPGIYWGNYFGPFYVDWFGREKFKTLPCVYKKELKDGGIFFTIADSPFEWNSDKARAMGRRAMEHLNPRAFFDLPELKKAVEAAVASGAKVTNDLPQRLIRPCEVPKFPFDLH
jgi:hypothetical protein